MIRKAPILAMAAVSAMASATVACGTLLGGNDVPIPNDSGVDAAGGDDATASSDGAPTIDGSGDGTTIDGGDDGGGDSAPGVDSGSDAGYDGATESDGGSDAASSAECTGRNGLSCHGSGTCVGPVCVMPQSCAVTAQGTTNCGEDAGESCCTSLEVDAGEDGSFDRTYPDDGIEEDAGYPATVSSFRLDKYLVTVGRFRQFMKAWPDGGAWTPDAGAGKHAHLNGGLGLQDAFDASSYEPGWSSEDDVDVGPASALNANTGGYWTWTVDAGLQENLPMSGVTWQEAYAFCIWDGAFLPSEAEWEYAATGGGQQLNYPWGATPAGAGYEYAIYNCYYPSGAMDCVSSTNIAPVGTAILGAGYWGQLDLLGEAWEWSLDWYAVAYGNPCINCGNFSDSSTANRVARGGSYDTSATLSPITRSSGIPTKRVVGTGFRCARTP